MEDKIEVGEYVRTKNGITGKIVRELSEDYYGEDLIRKSFIVDNNGQTVTRLDLNNEFYKRQNEYLIKCTDYIVKHSKNIIDLLEEGDYVNGDEIIVIYGYDEDGNDKDGLGICQVDDDYAYYLYLEDINIKSIVTKEQFESMKYEINN